MLQSSFTEWKCECVLAVMVRLHSNSHPENKIMLILQTAEQLLMQKLSVCVYMYVCVWCVYDMCRTHTQGFFIWFFGWMCVWVTAAAAAAAALCCHGDGWTSGWGWGFYCTWSRCCCIRQSVTHNTHTQIHTVQSDHCALFWTLCLCVMMKQ